MFDQRLAALVRHGPLHGVELHGLVAGRGRVVQVVTDCAERACHHHPAGFRFPRRLQYIAGADHVALEYFPAVGQVAFYGRDLGCHVIHAPAAFQRAPGFIQVANVAIYAFNLQSLHAFVVVLMSQQYPHAHAIFEQSAQQVGAHVPRRAGNKNRWR